jgi:hypothetical protein
MKFFVLISTLFLSFSVSAKRSLAVGEVIDIAGEADRMFLVSKPEVNKRKKQELDLFRKVYAGDLIVTHSNARIKIKLQDGTRVTLGENSSVELREFDLFPARARNVIVYQNWGKIRINVSKRGHYKDIVQLKSKFLTVGMKNGSEVLSNIYQVNSKTSNDVMVVKRTAQLIGSDSSQRGKVILMRSGEFYNNLMVNQNNWWDLPKLSRKALSYIKRKRNYLLPNLRLKDGSLFPLTRSLKSLLSGQTVSLRQSAVNK